MAKDILKNIRKVTCKTGLDVFFFKNRLLTRAFINNTLIKYVYFHIIDKCNLNCAYCDNFSPLQLDDWYIDTKIFNRNIKQLKNILSEIPYLGIGGGEPLLHPNLLEICYILRKYYPNSDVMVLSNGMLLQEYNEKLVEELVKMNVNIVVTEYPCDTIDYSKLYNLYKNKLMFTTQPKYKMHNLQISTVKKNGNKSYVRCAYSNSKGQSLRCFQLDHEGNFWFCGILANIHLLEKYFNIKFEKIKGKYGDYVNIFEISNIDDILYGINNKIPFCDYCSSSNYEVFDWEKSEKHRNEWLSEN